MHFTLTRELGDTALLKLISENDRDVEEIYRNKTKVVPIFFLSFISSVIIAE